MKTKRIAFGFLILVLMSCNFVTRLIAPSTPTPVPTLTLAPTLTVEPTSTPNLLAPAYIPPQCADKPLATVSPETAQNEPTLEAQPNARVSKSEQLSIFEDMTSKVDKVYVYPDFNGKDWKGIKAKYRGEIEAGLDTESFYREMESMIFELGDDHSAYLSPVDVKESNEELKGESNYVGIGISGEFNSDKKSVVVDATLPDSAAEHAGLQSHDSILQVDGLPIDEQYGNRLRGPECSVVEVEVESPGEAPRNLMLMRYRIEGGVPIDARLVSTTDGSKIGYIFLPSFFDETLPTQMEAALNKFGKLDGLILDLRLNGGGSSTVAYPILSFFTHGNLGKFVSRTSSRPLEIKANPIQNSQDVPLIVLVGEDTVSFAEIFSGTMQASGRAKIVGKTTLGNVEVLNGFDFNDGSLLWLATEKFVSAFTTADWEQTGIIPDAQAYAAWDTFYFDNDPAIAASLKLLGHQ